MSYLKKGNIKKCISLLEEFIDESREANNKKKVARLALDQLQRITAGTVAVGVQCKGHPRADLGPIG